jgi:hypothetical protein
MHGESTSKTRTRSGTLLDDSRATLTPSSGPKVLDDATQLARWHAGDKTIASVVMDSTSEAETLSKCYETMNPKMSGLSVSVLRVTARVVIRADDEDDTKRMPHHWHLVLFRLYYRHWINSTSGSDFAQSLPTDRSHETTALVSAVPSGLPLGVPNGAIERSRVVS